MTIDPGSARRCWPPGQKIRAAGRDKLAVLCASSKSETFRRLRRDGRVVRIVELSDHPGAMLRETRQRRVAAQDRAASRFEESVARHRVRIQEARDWRDQARAEHHWWEWLRGAFALRREQRQGPRPPGSAAPANRASDQEEILTAGVEGEHMVAAGLSRVLGDEWVLLRGYRNNRGEIDHLLLGPQGLIAIESKHRNATVHCDGDQWWFEKYDRFGNLVDRGGIADKRGRSPSVQLNEPAGLLEGLLRSHGYPVSIQRVVLFTHPRSALGRCRNPTVHIATSADYVIDLLNGSPPTLPAEQLAQLEQLIAAHHRSGGARHSR